MVTYHYFKCFLSMSFVLGDAQGSGSIVIYIILSELCLA